MDPNPRVFLARQKYEPRRSGIEFHAQEFIPSMKRKATMSSLSLRHSTSSWQARSLENDPEFIEGPGENSSPLGGLFASCEAKDSVLRFDYCQILDLHN